MTWVLIVAQCIMAVTLILMITGKTPLYSTAILGSTIAALVAGYPLSGDANITVAKMVNGGLTPVIADMCGVLLFIGVMQASGFMDVIIKCIIRVGRLMGGGPGIAVAGGIAAGIIGALTGFTQPAITGSVTGPAAVKLGVDPDKAAGITAHAGHLGNFAGFTHPSQVAIVATTGIGFGLINIYAAIVALSIFAVSFYRVKLDQKRRGVNHSKDEMARIAAEYEQSNSNIRPIIAFLPFIVLLAGFCLGFPVFIVGVVCGLLTIFLGKMIARKGEYAMLESVGRIATPLVATIGFLFMSATIKNIGLVDTISSFLQPVMEISPVLILFIIAALSGFLTQSYSSSAAIVLPILQVALNMGANPMAAAVAAGAGASIMQYFLTGGPVAALATVIPVIPGSNLKTANLFQRPSQLCGLAVAFIIVVLLSTLT